jgi:hypothetical protein
MSKNNTTLSSRQNITNLLAALSNISFSLSSLSLEAVNLLLGSNFDLSDCILNCSNHGFCRILSQSIICECESGYVGKKCQAKSSACSYHPCLNNATCIDGYNGTYSCQCASLYYGQNCENKVNLCQNETCSSNGFCKVNGTGNVSCICFQLYSGKQCEIVSAARVKIQTVVITWSTLAIVIITLVFLAAILNDLFDLLLVKNLFEVKIFRKFAHPKKKPKKAKVEIKFNYQWRIDEA